MPRKKQLFHQNLIQANCEQSGLCVGVGLKVCSENGYPRPRAQYRYSAVGGGAPQVVSPNSSARVARIVLRLVWKAVKKIEYSRRVAVARWSRFESGIVFAESSRLRVYLYKYL